ncbi:MAG: ABC transporter ATP-binding protein, partial [Clostridia bacterium]|nr:ABC transporter ATP-binding protein [Clostridia bacterium]
MKEDNNKQIASAPIIAPKGHGGPGGGKMRVVEKPKNFSKAMKQLISYLKVFWLPIIFVFIFAISSTIFLIVSPKLLGNMTSQIYSDLMANLPINFSILKNIAIKLLALYALSSGLAYAQGWIMTGVSQKIAYRLRRDISEKINRLPLAYFDKRTYGEVLSRVTNDVDTV